MLWNNRIEQIEQLHLNLLLKMISLSNFNAKMNSLKEVNLSNEVRGETNRKNVRYF